MGFITKEEKPNCVAEMTRGFVGCAPRPARLACSISGSRLGAVVQEHVFRLGGRHSQVQLVSKVPTIHRAGLGELLRGGLECRTACDLAVPLQEEASASPSVCWGVYSTGSAHMVVQAPCSQARVRR